MSENTKRSESYANDVEYNKRLKEQKKNIESLNWYRPYDVITLFFRAVCDYVVEGVKNLSNSKIFVGVIIPFILLFILLYLLPFTNKYIEMIIPPIYWAGYWLVLGIASSIGFGTGLHTGLLYLFPFIGQVCLTASICNNLNFDTYGDNSFHCEKSEIKHVKLFSLWMKVFIPCFFWGFGTAIGEIPPYLVSYAASKSGDVDEEYEEMTTQFANGDSIYKQMQEWMMTFLEKYGFWAVLAFAAWPNMFFDMCGIASGHFQLSFFQFFGGTFVGKALIKINFQALFLITLFSDQFLNILIDFFKNNYITYLHHIGDLIDEFSQKQRDKILNKNHQTNTSSLQFLWGIFVISMVLWFVQSVILQTAKNYQKKLDKISNEKWLLKRI